MIRLEEILVVSPKTGKESKRFILSKTFTLENGEEKHYQLRLSYSELREAGNLIEEIIDNRY